MPTLVIGCGQFGAPPHNHAAMGHVTMDSNPAVNPNIIGNIEATNSPLVTDPAHRGVYDLIVLENVPTFSTALACRNVLDNCTRALAPRGLLIFMTAFSARSKFDVLKMHLRTYGYTYMETDNQTNSDLDVSNRLGIDIDDIDDRWVLRAQKTRSAESPF